MGFRTKALEQKNATNSLRYFSKAAPTATDVIKINAIGADPEYICSVADLPHFRTRHEQRT
jgi:hypothetical protein